MTFTATGEPRYSSKALSVSLPHTYSSGSESSPPSGCIKRKFLQCIFQDPRMEDLRFPVFKKLKSKSAVIFLKYILLNKTSTLDASSKLRNMFKMT